MSILSTDLLKEKQLTTSAAAILSTSSSERYYLGHVTLTNTSASNVQVTLWRIATATSPTTGSGGNWLVIKTIPPNKTWVCHELEGHYLGKSESIYAVADTTLVVNIDISGSKEI